jgi:hypothetical protein
MGKRGAGAGWDAAVEASAESAAPDVSGSSAAWPGGVVGALEDLEQRAYEAERAWIARSAGKGTLYGVQAGVPPLQGVRVRRRA